MSKQQEVYLLKNVFAPLINNYLTSTITPLDFETLYLEARDKHLKSFGTGDLTRIMDEVFCDVDEYWAYYDPNNPEDADDPFCIDEQELRRRTEINYQKMLAIIAEYEKDA
jgi:Bacterial self-protective colicin-like immunity